MNILFITHFFEEFMVSEIPIVSVFGYFPYSCTVLFGYFPLHVCVTNVFSIPRILAVWASDLLAHN